MEKKERERETITKDDVGELDASELGLDSRLDDAKTEGSEMGGSDLKMESAKVGISGDQGFGTQMTYYDAIHGFASYLTTVPTFRSGKRGNADKMATYAAEFCAENDFDGPSDNFPENINFPKE